MWEHEKLTIYQKALDAASRLDALATRIPDGRHDLRDQLRRASASIPLNVAEGANEFSPAEKARFYRMARRSAAECAAILDVVQRVIARFPGCGDERKLLGEISAMLTTLIKRQPARR